MLNILFKFIASSKQVAAEALLMLLESPHEPLLYPFEEAILATESFTESSGYILKLSAPKRNVFLHLCMFLKEIESKGNNINDLGKSFLVQMFMKFIQKYN